jgi:Uma2 family endonuclease
MKAVIARVTEAELAARRRTGLDRWDEMWEGVLHMPPAPNYEHQRMLDRLIVALTPLLEQRNRGTLRSGINVFHETGQGENYRIPDLTFIARGHESVIAEDGIRGGGPDVVIEIRSPDDETYDKLPFYAAAGVSEVIVIDRDSKRSEIYRLAGSQYVAVQADRSGWLASEVLGIRIAGGGGDPRRLTVIIEDLLDPSRRYEI